MSSSVDPPPANVRDLLTRTDEERDLVAQLHPEDAADSLKGLSLSEASSLLQQLPVDYAAQVFERLDEGHQEALTEAMGVPAIAPVAAEMGADDLTDYLSLLPPPTAHDLRERLGQADPDVLEEVTALTQWEETSAGGLMTTDYISIAPHLTVRQAIAEIRRRAIDAETIDALFVRGVDDRLVGVLSLRRMLLAEPDDVVQDVMNPHVISVPPELDQEEVARKLAKYDLFVMPVVHTDSGQILGVITADDILDVLTEEQTEDVQKMGGLGPIREDYFATPFSVFLRKRGPWLLILFFGGLLTTETLHAHEQMLASVTQLSFYLPLLVSAGGNSGSQSSSLIIRGLAMGDVGTTDWARVLTRELLQGLALGTALAVVGVGRSLLTGDDPTFALLIGSTIVCIVVLGCVAGSMTPLALHRLGLDPATSSTPFIATVSDVAGILIYLNLAKVLLEGVLHLSPTPP